MRITEFGFTPHRVAALGMNVILLVNLAWSAVLCVRFLRGRGGFADLERWQTSYLWAYAGWAAIVVTVFPPVFGYIYQNRTRRARRPMKRLFAAVLLTTLPTAETVPQATAAAGQRLDSIAGYWVQRGMAVGILAAVARNNDMLLFKLYGKAGVEWDVPMPLDAMFEIGCTSATAAGVPASGWRWAGFPNRGGRWSS